MMKETSNAVKIIGGGRNEIRRSFDFYPTPSEVTIALLNFLDIPKPIKIWEPACGEGAISKILKNFGHDVYSTDIRKTEYVDQVLNFFKAPAAIQYDAIITNPPFSSADRFIRKALTHAPVVCMLLKSQFWHAVSRYNLIEKFPPAYICPLTWRPDFIGGGASQMDCLWTIWINGESNAIYKPLLRPKYHDRTDHLSSADDLKLGTVLYSDLFTMNEPIRPNGKPII